MTFDLPADLQRTADILSNSLMFRSGEKAPALPHGLFEDLNSRFGQRRTLPTTVAKASLFEKITSFVSTPAFGMAAAALVVVTVVLPSVLRDSGNTGTTAFRGGSTTAAISAPAVIVLIGAPEGTASFLGASGDFEKGSILSSDTATGSKVVVNFQDSTITSIDTTGQPVHTAALPADRDELSAAIAEALSKL